MALAENDPERVPDALTGLIGVPVAEPVKVALVDPVAGTVTVPTAKAENDALRLPEPEVMTAGIP